MTTLSKAKTTAYPDVVFQLDSSGGIEINLLQRLAHDVVGLTLARLGRLDRGGLVNVPLIVDIELAESIG